MSEKEEGQQIRNVTSQGRHHVKQKILSTPELIKTIAAKTGVDSDDCEKVLAILPVIFQECYAGMMGVRIKGLGTFRGRLLMATTSGKIKPKTVQTQKLAEAISKNRIVPDIVLDRGFLSDCAKHFHYLTNDEFRQLCPPSLLGKFELQRRVLKPSAIYDQFKEEEAFKEECATDAQRRIAVVLDLAPAQYQEKYT